MTDHMQRVPDDLGITVQEAATLTVDDLKAAAKSAREQATEQRAAGNAAAELAELMERYPRTGSDEPLGKVLERMTPADAARVHQLERRILKAQPGS